MILAVYNGKGGSQKTSIATALFVELANRGYKTLLLDLDQQFDSSFLLGADNTYPKTIYDVLLGKCTLDEAVQMVRLNGGVVAGSDKMGDFDMEVSVMEEPFYLLNDALYDDYEKWDFIICDLSPTAGAALKNVAYCADGFVIPVPAELLGVKAMSITYDRLMELKKVNPDLKVTGLVMGRHTRRANIFKSGESAIQDIAEKLNTKILGSIRDSAKVPEAHARKKTPVEYVPNSLLARDYRKFVDNLLAEVEKGENDNGTSREK